MNLVVLKGNLTRDVELRYTADGTAVAATGIAVSKKFKTQSGEEKEKVMFIDIAVWGKRGEVLSQYFSKGKPILIRGQLELEQWTAQDGTKRSRHTVRVDDFEFIEKKSDGVKTYGGEPTYAQPPAGGGESVPQHPPANPAAKQASQQPAEPAIPEIDVDEDEIPF